MNRLRTFIKALFPDPAKLLRYILRPARDFPIAYFRRIEAYPGVWHFISEFYFANGNTQVPPINAQSQLVRVESRVDKYFEFKEFALLAGDRIVKLLDPALLKMQFLIEKTIQEDTHIQIAENCIGSQCGDLKTDKRSGGF